MYGVYTIMRQDKMVCRVNCLHVYGLFLINCQLWPVMSLVVWACTSVVFIGDLEKASSLT